MPQYCLSRFYGVFEIFKAISIYLEMWFFTIINLCRPVKDGQPRLKLVSYSGAHSVAPSASFEVKLTFEAHQHLYFLMKLLKDHEKILTHCSKSSLPPTSFPRLVLFFNIFTATFCFLNKFDQQFFLNFITNHFS